MYLLQILCLPNLWSLNINKYILYIVYINIYCRYMFFNLPVHYKTGNMFDFTLYKLDQLILQ